MTDRSDRFSSEEDEKLIDLVRQHPPIYLVSGRSYKNAVVKNNIWKLIGLKMKKSDNDCKMRWKNIRDYYKRKKREYLKGTGTGTGVDDDTENNFAKKFQHLRFLDNTSLRQRRSITSSTNSSTQPSTQTAETETTQEMIEESQTQQSGEFASESAGEEQSQHTDDTPDQWDNDAQFQPEGEINSPLAPSEEHVAVNNVDVLQPLNGTQNTTTNNIQQTLPLNPSSNKSSVARDKTLVVLKEIRQGRAERTALIRELTQMPQSLTVAEKEESSDPAISMFFRSIATTVSNFSPMQKAKIKLEITNVVARYEMEHLTQSIPANTSAYSAWPETISSETSAPASQCSNVPTPVFSPHSCNSDITWNML